MLTQEMRERHLVGFYQVNPQNPDLRLFLVGGHLDPLLPLSASVQVVTRSQGRPLPLGPQEPPAGGERRLGCGVGRRSAPHAVEGRPGWRPRPRPGSVCPPAPPTFRFKREGAQVAPPSPTESGPEQAGGDSECEGEEASQEEGDMPESPHPSTEAPAQNPGGFKSFWFANPARNDPKVGFVLDEDWVKAFEGSEMWGDMWRSTHTNQELGPTACKFATENCISLTDCVSRKVGVPA